MRKIKLFTTLCLAFLLSLSFIKSKAYDSIDSTGQTEWNIISEEEQSQYGVYYSHQIGKPKTNGANGTEKNVPWIITSWSFKPAINTTDNDFPIYVDFKITLDFKLKLDFNSHIHYPAISNPKQSL